MNHGGAYHEQQRTGIALPFLWPVLLGLIWIYMILLANPIGNFPLNDDWAYAYTVQHLLQHGELRFFRLDGYYLFGQVLWGTLFCLPFGFSLPLYGSPPRFSGLWAYWQHTEFCGNLKRLAFNLQNNYEIDRRYPVQRWLPWRQGAGEVIIQRRIAGEPRSANVSLPASLQLDRRYGNAPVRFGGVHTSLFSP
jgi:hypothetical protein